MESRLPRYCRHFGIDSTSDTPRTQKLVNVARYAYLNASLPPGWTEHNSKSREGGVYFRNVIDGISTWSHPIDAIFRRFLDIIALSPDSTSMRDEFTRQSTLSMEDPWLFRAWRTMINLYSEPPSRHFGLNEMAPQPPPNHPKSTSSPSTSIPSRPPSPRADPNPRQHVHQPHCPTSPSIDVTFSEAQLGTCWTKELVQY